MQVPMDWIRPGFVLKPDTEESERALRLAARAGMASVSMRSVGDATTAGESQRRLESVSEIDRVSKSESQDMGLTVVRSCNRTSR